MTEAATLINKKKIKDGSEATVRAAVVEVEREGRVRHSAPQRVNEGEKCQDVHKYYMMVRRNGSSDDCDTSSLPPPPTPPWPPWHHYTRYGSDHLDGSRFPPSPPPYPSYSTAS
ncbi:hypothetical protein Pmani_025227 [Petrolisthes manimaculis]|uniref:Uncharacterized protein n=1 Tax=Petrolisthes manimaculis TaxID=1843537 RepID=A0AAE1P602_9EUCA|nr:hypothetical protein Pmani_025227 [Petrolisthes manimaculis]